MSVYLFTIIMLNLETKTYMIFIDYRIIHILRKVCYIYILVFWGKIIYSKSEAYNTLDYFIVKHVFYGFSKPFDFVYKGWQMLYEWYRVDLQILEWITHTCQIAGIHWNRCVCIPIENDNNRKRLNIIFMFVNLLPTTASALVH